MNRLLATALLSVSMLLSPSMVSAQGAGLRWQHDNAGDNSRFSLTARLAPSDKPLPIQHLWLEPEAQFNTRLKAQALNLNLKWDWRFSADWDLSSSFGFNYSLSENGTGLNSLRPASVGGYFGLRYKF
jgi:hypothetical protein